ncbi:MAG: hypothetical protein R2762_23975 [Bryobacteraceae bacterium]
MRVELPMNTRKTYSLRLPRIASFRFDWSDASAGFAHIAETAKRALWSRRRVPVAALLLIAACSSKPTPVATLGEHLQVGSFLFTALDAEWLADLPGEVGPRLPKHRFLTIRLSAVNQGTRELHVPILRLEGADGATHPEVEDGAGVEDWWGLIRPVAPGASESRRILFDVEPGEYKLHLNDGGDPEREQSGVVTIPYRIRNEQPLPLPEPRVE